LLKNFSLFIALRYLKPKRTYVSIITLISVIGVTLGVAVLVIVIAVMTGFEKKLQDLILGFEPHVWVKQAGTPENWDPTNEDTYWRTVLEKVKVADGVESAAPYMMGQILLRFGADSERRQLAMMMMGLDGDDLQQTGRMKELLRDGEIDLGMDPESGRWGCVVSAQFASANGISVAGSEGGFHEVEALSLGDDVQAMLNEMLAISKDKDLDEAEAGRRLKELTKEVSLTKDLRVTGLFDSMGYADMMFVPLTLAQELYEYDLDDNVHGIAVRVDNAVDAAAVASEIGAVLPPGWYTETWIDRHETRFAAIRNERVMMYFVLFFIVLVAAFSTMNTMITVTVQKRHEIGVMKALGARVSQIVWVFLAQGMIVGFIGAVAGLGLGKLVLTFRNDARAWLAEKMDIHVFSEATYGIAEIPAELVGSDVAVICIGAFVLCSLAALPPAYMVARLDPAKALRD